VSSTRHGWILQWFVKGGRDFVDRSDIGGMTVERLQDLFDEPSPDDMMCYSYAVGPEHVDGLQPNVGCEIDLSRFDYFVSGWAERGFRTPGGLYPPPKDLPPFFEGARPVRPVTPADSTNPGRFTSRRQN
jgi:hypothetical protein